MLGAVILSAHVIPAFPIVNLSTFPCLKIVTAVAKSSLKGSRLNTQALLVTESSKIILAESFVLSALVVGSCLLVLLYILNLTPISSLIFSKNISALNSLSPLNTEYVVACATLLIGTAVDKVRLLDICLVVVLVAKEPTGITDAVEVPTCSAQKLR